MSIDSNITAATADELSKTQFICVFDVSGSTSRSSTRFNGKTRWEEMQEDAGRIAREAAKYDPDGIDIVVFNTAVKEFFGTTADKVDDVFAEFAPGGTTNTAGAVRAVTKRATDLPGNVVVMVFTDGGADSEADALNAMRDAAKGLGRPKIGFIFVQVGNDAGAVQFLERLNAGLGSGYPDIVATVTAVEAESLSLGQLVTLAQTA